MLIFLQKLVHYFSRNRAIAARGVPYGFTLVELLVVSAIIFIITAFVFFQQAQFNSSTLMRSLAYNVALSIRQAQIYGTSVRELTPGAGTFGKGYGVYVPTMGTASKTYYLFSDLDGDGRYDAGEELPVYTVGRSYYLKSTCVVVSPGVCTDVTAMTIFFRRPNPDACFSHSLQPSACGVGAAPLYEQAYVIIGNTGNADTRAVKISSTGQIAVCPTNATSC